MNRFLQFAVLCGWILGAPALHAKGPKPPIVVAAEQGDLAKVKTLLDQGADVEAVTVENETPLMAASAKGHKEVAALLLQRGAKINSQSKTAPYHTALFTAVVNQREDMVAYLLTQGGDVSIRDSVDKTMLVRAREGKNPKIIEMLSAATKAIRQTPEPKSAGLPAEVKPD